MRRFSAAVGWVLAIGLGGLAVRSVLTGDPSEPLRLSKFGFAPADSYGLTSLQVTISNCVADTQMCRLQLEVVRGDGQSSDPVGTVVVPVNGHSSRDVVLSCPHGGEVYWIRASGWDRPSKLETKLRSLTKGVVFSAVPLARKPFIDQPLTNNFAQPITGGERATRLAREDDLVYCQVN